MSQQILALREKRTEKWNAAKAFLDSKRGADGLVSAEDTAVYDRMETEVVNLGKEIERLERQRDLDAALAAPTTNAVTNTPQAPGRPTEARASEEYRHAFWNAMRCREVSNVLQTGSDPDGGYLVPTEFETQLVKALDENNVVRGIAKVFTTSAPSKIPVQANGAQAFWTAENAAIPETSLTFAQADLEAHKIATYIKISSELLQDSFFGMEAYIAAEFGRAFGVLEEQAFCVGDGTGKPKGIFTATGGEFVPAGGAIVSLDDVINLIYGLKAPYRRNARFLLHDDTIRGLRKLKDGNGAYLWQPSNQLGEPDRLMGYPIHTSPYAPTVAPGALPVAFGDFTNYWIADRAGFNLKRLGELFALNDQVGFTATKRVDGKTLLKEGIKLLQMP